MSCQGSSRGNSVSLNLVKLEGCWPLSIACLLSQVSFPNHLSVAFPALGASKPPQPEQAVSRALVALRLICELPRSLHERGYAYDDHSSFRRTSGYRGLPSRTRRAGVGPAPGSCPKAPG